jgi:signal transduction histidine kinase
MTLLRNAGEAIRERGTVTVTTGFAGEHVRVTIRDTGVGMDDATLAAVFEPSFSRSGQRVKSGMGLLAAANIMRRKGGGIEAESAVGQGSEFRLWLPLSAPHEEAAAGA